MNGYSYRYHSPEQDTDEEALARLRDEILDLEETLRSKRIAANYLRRKLKEGVTV